MIEKFCFRLREKREELKLTIEQVVEKTKLFPGVIRNIEAGNIAAIDQAYLKGYIKIYAAFLGMDSSPVLNTLGIRNMPLKFQSHKEFSNSQNLPPYLHNTDKPANLYPIRRFRYSSQQAYPQEETRQDVSRKKIEAKQIKNGKTDSWYSPSIRTFNWLQIIETIKAKNFSIVQNLIVFLKEKITLHKKQNALVRIIFQARMPIIKTIIVIVIITASIGLFKTIVNTAARLFFTPKKIECRVNQKPVKKIKKTEVKKTAPASTPVILFDSTVKELTLSVTGKRDCYIHVKVDGKLLFEGVLKKGIVDSWRGTKDIDVRVNDGSAVYIEVNGRPLPILTTMRKTIKSLKVTTSGITIDK